MIPRALQPSGQTVPTPGNRTFLSILRLLTEVSNEQELGGRMTETLYKALLILEAKSLLWWLSCGLWDVQKHPCSLSIGTYSIHAPAVITISRHQKSPPSIHCAKLVGWKSVQATFEGGCQIQQIKFFYSINIFQILDGPYRPSYILSGNANQLQWLLGKG